MNAKMKWLSLLQYSELLAGCEQFSKRWTASVFHPRSYHPRLRLCRAASIVCLLSALGLLGQADELAEKGRAIFKNNQNAVVTVQLVIKAKISMPGAGLPDTESKKDATGTVVDPSGLTVVALSELDPGGMLQNMLGGMGGDEEAKFKMETELSDVKLLLEDGTELPSEVVLRDKDLDLAFIRPKVKPANPMPALDLSKAGRAQVLDQVIALNRLGQAAGRAHAVSVERICAVVQKPRFFYIPDSTITSTSMGCPAFTLDGDILGVFVMRTIKTQSSGGGMMGMFSFQPENLTSVIIPAADILKATKQALEVKSEAKPEGADQPK